MLYNTFGSITLRVSQHQHLIEYITPNNTVIIRDIQQFHDH